MGLGGMAQAVRPSRPMGQTFRVTEKREAAAKPLMKAFSKSCNPTRESEVREGGSFFLIRIVL